MISRQGLSATYHHGILGFMSLYPVSHRSTRNALQEITGSKNITDIDVCDRYYNRIQEDQPILFPGMAKMSAERLYTAKLARSKAGFHGIGYVSGALIFFSAVENQAAYRGVGIKKLVEDDLSAWERDTVMGVLNDEDKANASAIAYNVNSDENLKELMETPQQDSRSLYEQIIAGNLAAYQNNPLLEQHRGEMGKIAVTLFSASSIAVSKFLTDEPHFTSFMQETWNIETPAIVAGQQMGACDMRSLLQSAGVE